MTFEKALVPFVSSMIAKFPPILHAVFMLATPIHGKMIPIVADTICLHGDGTNAVTSAQRLKSEFLSEGIQIK